MRVATGGGTTTAKFETHWLVYGPTGDIGLSANLAAIRSAGIASGQFSADGCRIFYEGASGFLTFLYFAQGHAQLADPSEAFEFPAQPLVCQYAYPSHLTMMSLIHFYAPSMTQANPAYGSGAGQSLSNTPWTVTGQGPVVIAAFEELTGLDYIETILKPTLRVVFAGASGQIAGTNMLPTGYEGIVDFDFETWYPKATYYETATTAVPNWYDDAGEYFLRWCRTGDKATWNPDKDLPSNHFVYCPRPNDEPLFATDAEAKALFWDITERMWAGIKAVMQEVAPRARMQIYGWPPAPSYYDYAYWTPTEASEQANKATAETKLNEFIAKWTDPLTTGRIITLLDNHAPSWYFNYGDTLPPGSPSTITYPWSTNPNTWSYYQRGKLLHSYGVAARKLADHYGKPLVPYLDAVVSTSDNPATSPANESDLYGPAVDVETAKIYGSFIASFGCDGLMLWGYYHPSQGNTSLELETGIPRVQTYIIERVRATRTPFAMVPSYNYPPPPVASP